MKPQDKSQSNSQPIRVKAGFIPHVMSDKHRGDEHRFEQRTLAFESRGERLEVSIPLLSEAELIQLSEHLITQQKSYLATLTISTIVDTIDQAIKLLLDRKHPLRRKAEALLPIVTGYSAEMIRLALTSYLKTFRKPQLLRFLAEDFANPTLLDDFRPAVKGSFIKAYGPNLTAHIWAGNVPGLPLWSLISALLVKSASIGKVSSSEPLFAGWFVEALALIDPDMANCIAIAWWKGGDVAREKAVFQRAQLVLGYGSNDSLAALRERIPITTRFITYGHKVSFGMIAREVLNAEQASSAARQAAHDIVRFEQQGCYSPHLFYVEQGGNINPKQFAHSLAHELSALEHKFPRRPLTLEEQMQYAQARQAAELEAMQSISAVANDSVDDSVGNITVLGSNAQTWTVIYEEQEKPRFLPSPLDRFIRVIAVQDLRQVAAIAAPYEVYLQTVALAAMPCRLYELARELGEIGVTRITALGRMTEPEAGWHHDGRFNLLDLVRIVEIEQAAEEASEHYALYRD